MAYHCKHCSFVWDTVEGDIQKLLAHEKTHKKEGQLMLTCNKCYNGHHDQCMGKAGMFDCDCKCFKK